MRASRAMKRLVLVASLVAGLTTFFLLGSESVADSDGLAALLSRHEDGVQELASLSPDQNSVVAVEKFFQDRFWQGLAAETKDSFSSEELLELPSGRLDELRELLTVAAARPYSFWEPTLELGPPSVPYRELFTLSAMASALATLDWEQGKRREAIDLLMNSLRISQFPSELGLLGIVVRARAMESPLDALRRIVSSGSLTKEELLYIGRGLDELHVGSVGFGEAADADFSMTWRLMNRLANGQSVAKPELSGTIFEPGSPYAKSSVVKVPYFRHNKSVWTNYHLKHRGAFYDHTVFEPEIETELDDRWGVHIPRILLANWWRIRLAHLLRETEVNAVSALVEIELYRILNGEYPQSIIDLAADARPVNYLARDGKFVYRFTDSGFELLGEGVGFSGLGLPTPYHFHPYRK